MAKGLLVKGLLVRYEAMGMLAGCPFGELEHMALLNSPRPAKRKATRKTTSKLTPNKRAHLTYSYPPTKDIEKLAFYIPLGPQKPSKKVWNTSKSNQKYLILRR